VKSGSRRVRGGVACDGGADSVIQFYPERGDDETKHYRKMKQRQRDHLVSMESKHDTT
jgi:hypothetical protein